MMSRVNTQAVKVLFTIDIKTLALKNVKDVGDGSSINVCFERSGKLASTKDKILRVEGGIVTVDFNEALSLVVTLYRNPDGTYQQKIGKLVIRQPKSSLLGGFSFRGVGIIALNLDEFAGDFETRKQNLPLSKCPEGGSGVLETLITAKFIGDADLDETGSNMSGSTCDNISVTDAAEFERSSSPPSSGPAKTQVPSPTLKAQAQAAYPLDILTL